MAALRDTLRRFAVSILARHRGEVRALQDVRLLQESLRFAGVFAVLMLLPTSFLAWQALSSVRSEELSLDADLQGRARAVSSNLQRDLENIFARFEAATAQRLRQGESPAANLAELSPFLRAAFRFDATGALAAPFDLPSGDVEPEPPAAWRRAAARARSLEPNDPGAAGAAWRALGRSSPTPPLAAEALLGEIRCLTRMDRLDLADEAAIHLYEAFGQVRSRHGFRMDDVAVLKRLEIRLARGSSPDADRGALEDFVTTLLSTRQWEIGREAEPVLVRAALRLLQGRSDPDWIASARRQLNERYAQLTWAEQVVDELELLFSRMPEELQFRYLGARSDSAGVWSIVRSGEDLFAFSFSVADLHREIEAGIERINAEDDELLAQLVAGDPVPEAAMSVRGLGPWLPAATLVIQPADPEALEASKDRRRTLRAGVVFTAVFVSVLGVFWVARMIAFEVEAARQRADFAANVSHELRSPITQIRLKGEALMLGLVDPGADTEAHFAAIVREAERLSRLVDNVLDFAAIERGAKRYHMRPDDLVPVVMIAVEAARSSFDELDMTVELDLPEDLDPVWIDREAMGQVMTNLLSNAAKYGAAGRHVRVAVVQTAAGIEVSVADRGIGIDPEEIPKVFDDFFRSGDPAVRRSKGTGIGLAIVRYIVEAHGGEIRVESVPRRGCHLHRDAAPTAPRRGGRDHLMPRILFVEDEQALLDTVDRFFKREGFDVHLARSMSEAMEIHQRFPPDVVVLDVMLNEGPEPDQSGFDVCKALRDADYEGPVIFVTARTAEQDKLIGFDLGADDYVTKPFSLLELKARVQAPCSGAPAAPARSTASATGRGRPRQLRDPPWRRGGALVEPRAGAAALPHRAPRQGASARRAAHGDLALLPQRHHPHRRHPHPQRAQEAPGRRCEPQVHRDPARGGLPLHRGGGVIGLWASLAGPALAQSDPRARAALHDAMALEGIDGDLEAAASRYLRLSRNLAMDDRTRAEALYLLGRTMYDLGRVDPARAALLEGIRSGVCPTRCRDLLETIEIDLESVTTTPVVWTFDQLDHGFFHPWMVQDLGSIRLATPEFPGRDAALAWSTSVQSRRPDRLVMGIHRPDPPPTEVMIRIRSARLDALVQVMVEDEAGARFWLPDPLTLDQGRIETLVVELADLRPAPPGADRPMDPSRLVRLSLVDVTGLKSTGDNTLWIYAFSLR